MPNGYWDRILHVDLTARTTWTESLGEAFWRRHLGGRALIAHYLLSGVPVGADPLSPENLLVFAAGVLTGTPFPGAGRHSVGAKSPLTGLFGESEAGGFWGAELRHAGWDGIVVHGRADKPVYLWIQEQDVEIKDAAICGVAKQVTSRILSALNSGTDSCASRSAAWQPKRACASPWSSTT